MYRPDLRRDPHPEMRLSDADRDDAVARLGEHYAAGRLDKDEFDERSDAVWTAKTGADLAPVFADLGPLRPTRTDRPGAGGPWSRRGWLPLPFVPLVFVLIALTVVTHLPFVLLAFLGCLFLFSRRRRRRSWRGA